MEMTSMGRHEYLKAIHERYRQGSPEQKGAILDEFCRICGYHRKYAIRLLNRPKPGIRPRKRLPRGPSYGPPVIQALSLIWEAAGYPWSVRLKAMLPLWMPWLRKRLEMTPELERQMQAISARQIDRRLQPRRCDLSRRIYGRTKPGTLLKHQVPIKVDHWNVKTPGFTEIDLVSHSGDCATGEFAYSFNLTDIQSTWTESRAVLGKAQQRIVAALDDVRSALPFKLKGIDSDNGSEFLNHHLITFCKKGQIQFTRGRPYKKNDNAHIEQKNWTHVRRLIGWGRLDSQIAVDLLNNLYTNELRLMMNLFQPSVKLVSKKRVGSKLKRVYDAPQTPLDRIRAAKGSDHDRVNGLLRLRAATDPFKLAITIQKKLNRVWALNKRSDRVTSQMA